MPMYQYSCRSCEERFEKRLPMAQASDPQACPQCGSQETRKLIGAVAISSGSGGASLRAERPAGSPFS